MDEDQVIEEMIVDDFTPFTHALESAEEGGSTDGL